MRRIVLHAPLDRAEVVRRIESSIVNRPTTMHPVLYVYNYFHYAASRPWRILGRVTRDGFEVKKFAVVESLLAPILHARLVNNDSGGTRIEGSFRPDPAGYLVLGAFVLVYVGVGIVGGYMAGIATGRDGRTLLAITLILAISAPVLAILVAVTIGRAQAKQEDYIIEFLRQTLVAELVSDVR